MNDVKKVRIQLRNLLKLKALVSILICLIKQILHVTTVLTYGYMEESLSPHVQTYILDFLWRRFKFQILTFSTGATAESSTNDRFPVVFNLSFSCWYGLQATTVTNYNI